MPALSEGLKILITGDLSQWTSSLTKAGTMGLQLAKKLSDKWTATARTIRNAGLVAFGALSGVILKATNDAAKFEKAFAEVTTLMDNPPLAELESLKGELGDLSQSFGQPIVDQTQALYQAMSAGATESADAMGLLNTANRMSIGGLTDVRSAIDVLTSAVQAYSRPWEDATDISDVLFTTMRRGKTTIDELTGSLGRVIPVSAQLRVPLEEVGAAVATMTVAGLQTDEAMTALRSTLMQIIRPTSDAKDAAEELGVQIGTLALEEKGLYQYLQDVYTAAEGNTEAIGRLFPNVRALNGVLAMTGERAGFFADVLQDMGERAGATETAFEKMANTTWFRWNQLKQSINAVWRELGEAFLPIVEKVISRVTPVIQRVAQWISENEELVIQIAAWTAGISAAAVALGTLGLAVNGIIGLLGSLLAAVVGVVLVLSPVGAVAAATLGGALLAVAGILAALGFDIDAFINDPMAEMKRMVGVIIAEVNSLGKTFEDIFGITVPDALNAGLQAVKKIAEGMRLAFDAVRQAVDAVVTAIRKLQDLAGAGGFSSDVMSAGSMAQAFGGLHGGGWVQRRQGGGWIRGGGDSVPALLEPGEFVINRQAAAIYGPIVEAINAAGGRGGGGSVTINAGGLVDRRYIREELVPEIRRAMARGDL